MIGSFDISGHRVGKGGEAFIIAEVAQNHDGSVNIAHAYIDAVAKTGAQAIKFQTHIAEAESSPGEPFRIKFSYADQSRYEYWQRMAFTKAQWAELKRHAEDRGLVFLSSPFSFEAVELLSSLGIAAWKVGSGEVTNHPMLSMLGKTGKPVLLSSGMSTFSELDDAQKILQQTPSPWGVFQCTTAYPCPPDKVGLNVITELQSRYQCPVGLSDHSANPAFPIAAVALGAKMIEVHVSFSKECFGPDVPASLTTSELTQMVSGIRAVETSLNHPVAKDAMASELGGLRQMFQKSIFYQNSLDKGAVLTSSNIAFRKPGTGISASRANEYIGKAVTHPVVAGDMLKESDFE